MQTTPDAAATLTQRQLRYLLSVISDLTRWRILIELHKSEPLPVNELAHRLSVPATNISNHCARLFKAGIVHRTYGRCYKIAPTHLTPGQSTLNLGPIVLRLDSFPVS